MSYKRISIGFFLFHIFNFEGQPRLVCYCRNRGDRTQVSTFKSITIYMKANYLFSVLIVLLALAVLPVRGQLMTFTIMAGQTNAIGTNDGNGTAALFNHPRGVAADKAGNVYVADSYNGSIRRIAPDGTVTTLTCETLPPVMSNVINTNEPYPPYIAFNFAAPESILVDGNTNIYISDNNIIYSAQLDTNTNGPNAVHTGQYLLTLVAGDTDVIYPINGDIGLQFNHVSGMALDANSNLFFADQYNQVVREVTPSRAVSIVAGMLGVPQYLNGTGTNAGFYFPYGVAVGVSNTVYVTDGFYGVRQVTQGNVVSNFWGFNGYTPAHAITTDAAGNVYVVGGQVGTNYVLQITPAGVSNVLGTLPTTGMISAIAVDANTNIYLADQQNSVIIKSVPYPAFFNGQVTLGNNTNYLVFTNGTPFGYYNLASFTFPLFYHYDLGFESFFDAEDGRNGVYLYDFASATSWYTSPQEFPYLYDFGLNAWLYYFPDPNRPGHYTKNPRYFYDFSQDMVITK